MNRRSSPLFVGSLATLWFTLGAAVIAQAPAASNPGRIAQMQHHYGDVTLVHEAVTRGDLMSLREPARRLSTLATPPDVPASAARFIDAIRAAGRQALSATSVRDAAMATAAMLTQCGSCHQAQSVRPVTAASPRPDVGGLVGHMLDHQRALDQLLLGLVLPSPGSWRSGMEALRVAALLPSELPAENALTSEIAAREKTVHALASRAVAETVERRQSDYGDLLSACASCHSLHRRIWGPGTGAGK